MNRKPSLSTIKAAACYCAVTYCFAFFCGVVRVLILRRFLGELEAVLVELPFVLRVAWYVCHGCIRRWNIQTTERSSMGCIAFIMLQILEFSWKNILMKKSLREYCYDFYTWAGFLGLLGQVTFGFLPSVTSVSSTNNDSTKVKV